MSVICPTITAYDTEIYNQQIANVRSFAKRLHIDLMDGQLAPTQSPPVERVWWPAHMEADIHLMYRQPMKVIQQLIKLEPRMVVIHAEAEVDHMHFAAQLHAHNIEAGLALLQDTPLAAVQQIMHSFDHILVFSGKLGFHGGSANLGLLEKVRQIQVEHPEAELGWDGGINQPVAQALLTAGVDVLNVGGFIQGSDDPQAAFQELQQLTR